MKCFLSIMLMLLAIGQQALAATNVSGTITGVTTFAKANGPYIVDAHLLVAEGATLIIEPGTEIRIDSAVNFFVEGTLRAAGTITDPIVFKSNATNPTRTSWQGIHVRFMGVIDSVLFDYCNFTSSALALDVWAAKLSVTHCTFIECEKAISLHDAGKTSFIVADNIIKHGELGINTTASGVISANEFAHLNQGAITADGADVAGNYIHDCGNGMFLLLHGNEVSGNKVVNVTYQAYSINDQSPAAGSVHHNLSAYNGFGYVVNLFASSVEHNSSVHDSIGILMYDAVAPSVFKNNCIDSCTSYYVKVDGAYDTDISGNYWGTTDTALLNARMFDYYDNFVAPKGLILPVLTQPDTGCQSYEGPLVTGVATTKAQNPAVSVSPNPFVNSFIIDLHSQATQLTVFNLAGQRIISLDASGKNKMEVDMSAYPAGVYHYLLTRTDHTTATGKLVKQE